MPQYRVPFHGTALVEAETPIAAQVAADSWVVSMKQATHGVEMQRPRSGKISALDMWTKKQVPSDVTEAFAAHAKQWQARRKEHEVFCDVVEEMCRSNVGVGHQYDWEEFEMKHRHRETRDERFQSARALFIKAVIDGAQLYQNEALIPGGYVEQEAVRESSWSADGALRKKMQWVAEIIANRYLTELMEMVGQER